METLVTPEWLAAHLDTVQVVDATTFLPGTARDADAEFRAAHIPGAVRLDIKTFADPDASAPHMLPPPALASQMLGALGLERDRPIVVYDDSPLRTAPRVWFTLRHYGARDVAVLDGGLARWRNEGRPVESGDPSPASGNWPVTEPTRPIVTKALLLEGAAPPVVDARAYDRFTGEAEEPREGMGSGHIPGARSLPFGELYADDGTMKRGAELEAAFEARGVDPYAPFTASCGSGVTACSSLLAAHLLGSDAGRLYDGSWSEWGADPETPKEKGPPA